MAFLFKSKKHQDREKDRVLTSREGPTSGSQQSSITSIGARIAKDEKTVQRSTPNGSLNSLDIDATGSPDRAAYARRPPIDQTPATAPAPQGPPPPSSDLQVCKGPLLAVPRLADNLANSFAMALAQRSETPTCPCTRGHNGASHIPRPPSARFLAMGPL